jgi:negative regulator of flagellin synthesis FlgM
MKINDLNSVGIDQVQANQTQTAGAARPPETAASAASGRDVIHLSPQARLLQKASQIAQATPEVRPEKVLALKDSVDQGTYTVDSAKVADKLITAMLTEKT